MPARVCGCCQKTIDRKPQPEHKWGPINVETLCAAVHEHSGVKNNIDQGGAFCHPPKPKTGAIFQTPLVSNK